jgi:hypothetical protein
MFQVTFGVMLKLDGGSSVLSQAGRVHEKHEEMGIFRYIKSQHGFLVYLSSYCQVLINMDTEYVLVFFDNCILNA